MAYLKGCANEYMSMGRFRVYFLRVLTILLASCATSSSVMQVSAQSSINQAVVPVQVGSSPLTVKQAWGDGHIKQFNRRFDDFVFSPGGSYSQNSVTDDEQVCGRLSPASNTTDAQAAQQENALALVNLQSGALTILQQLPVGYQMASCAATGAWLIWTQAKEEDTQTLWQVEAVNRQTHEVRLLDTNAEHLTSALVPYPSSDHGLAAWTSFVDAQGHVAALIYDFAAGKKSLQSPGTAFPLISWPWISWGDSTQGGIVFQNIATKQHVVLKSSSISTTAFNYGAFVAASADYSTITLYPSIAANMLTASSSIGHNSPGDFVEFPTLNDRLVTWGSNGSLYAFDRKSHRTVQIADNLAGDPWPMISSHYMIWQDADGMLDVLDTNALP